MSEQLKLVPASMLLDQATIGAIFFHCGDGSTIDVTECSEGVLWIGAVTDDDGNEVYGLHLSTAEYPEEGSTTLVEFAAPQPPALDSKLQRVSVEWGSEVIEDDPHGAYVTYSSASRVEHERNQLQAEVDRLRKDAERYQWLRGRDVETICLGGVFAGVTPENLVINGEDLDRHVDAAMAGATAASVCTHEWTDDGQFMLVCTACGAQEDHDPHWRAPDTAPKDGSLLRLLVEFTEHATDDADQAVTIGANSYDDTGEDVWQFAGWDWEQDRFTQGQGVVVGWLPLLDCKAVGGKEHE